MTDEMRTFNSGATRNSDQGKLDFEGFLSPAVLERYAQYLYKHRKQADGAMRESDNWQKGIPKDVYMKSAFRHFVEVWKNHRGLLSEDLEESLCAVLFNIMGYLFEELKKDVGQEKYVKGVTTGTIYKVLVESEDTYSLELIAHGSNSTHIQDIGCRMDFIPKCYYKECNKIGEEL